MFCRGLLPSSLLPFLVYSRCFDSIFLMLNLRVCQKLRLGSLDGCCVLVSYLCFHCIFLTCSHCFDKLLSIRSLLLLHSLAVHSSKRVRIQARIPYNSAFYWFIAFIPIDYLWHDPLFWFCLIDALAWNLPKDRYGSLTIIPFTSRGLKRYKSIVFSKLVKKGGGSLSNTAKNIFTNTL